jgi:hypothetical protein
MKFKYKNLAIESSENESKYLCISFIFILLLVFAFFSFLVMNGYISVELAIQS